MSPRPAVQENRVRQRDRILEAFAERARTNGPRAVVMAELARDLGISTRTLYQQFASKAEIVEEIVAIWTAEVDAEQQALIDSELSIRDRMIEAAASWIAGQDRFSEAFWLQIASDFPEASRILAQQVRKSLAFARHQLAAEIHEGLDVDLALSLLKGSVLHALDPRRCDRLGLARQDAVRQAVELWCRGALRPAARGD
jgi:AcrR family transcriptional regulator